MATVVNRPNGHKWVQVRVGDKRHTLRLGKVSKEQATDFRRRIESLVAARAYGQLPDQRTLEWLGTLERAVYSKLVNVGLVEQNASAASLKELLEAHAASLDVKPSSASTFTHTARNLREFFGETRDYRRISPGDAQEFRTWLTKFGRHRGPGKGGPLSAATVSRRCRRARQIFTFAVNKRWIFENPFAGMKGWTESNRERDYYVSLEVMNRLLEHAAPEMRLLIAVTRLAGVRCGSEIWPMEWTWIDWANGTIRVRAPKTERYPNGSSRLVPIVPQLLEHLQAAWHVAPEGATLMFPGSQVSNAALSKRLAGVCRLAGVDPWQKPFNNMRASCETDWIAQHGDIFKVAAWMGHSPQVALQHYSRIAKDLNTAAAGSSSDIPKAKQKAKLPYRPEMHS